MKNAREVGRVGEGECPAPGDGHVAQFFAGEAELLDAVGGRSLQALRERATIHGRPFDYEGPEPRARAGQAGGAGIDVRGLKVVSPGSARFHHHQGAGAGRQEQGILQPRPAQEVAVALQDPEPVPLQPEVEEAVGAQIADRPDLELARAADGSARWPSH